MLDNDSLMKEWSVDCKLDQTKLLERMASHPLLHSKYLTHLQTYKVKLRSLTLKYQKLRQTKTRYYNGELGQEELIALNLKQYQYKKPLKSEMETLLDADTDLQLIQEQILYIETLATACESILKDVTNQYFLFKSIIDYTKFQAGL